MSDSSILALGKFGHHPDALIDAQVELDRLEGLLCEAHGGLLRALDYRAATPEGIAIKNDVRDCLRRTGFQGEMGVQGGGVPVHAGLARERDEQAEESRSFATEAYWKAKQGEDYGSY